MAGYSNDEIEAAVVQFVKTSVRTRRDPLGPVDMGSAFGDVLQLFSSTLLFDPNAIFYLVYLATNKLNVSVLQALSYIADLVEAVDEVSKRTTEITNQALLGDASAALLEMDSLLSSNSTVSNPALVRYEAALNSFIQKDLAPNIKSGHDIVRPPPLARSDSFENLSLLDTAYADILAALVQVRKILDEFTALDLPLLTIQSTVRQARYDLSDLQTYFSGSASSAEKIAKCREAYLRLTSGRAVLTNLTTISDPQEPRLISTSTSLGQAALATSDGEMVSAVVQGTKSAPWAITPGSNDQLILREDNAGSPTTYTLVPPAYPSVETAIHESFILGADAYAEIASTLAGPYTIVLGNEWFGVQATKPNGEFAEYKGMLPVGLHSGAAMAGFISSLLLENGVGAPLSTVANVTYTTELHITQQLPGDDRALMIGQYMGVGWAPIDANTALGFTAGDTAYGAYANDGFQLDGGNVATLPHGAITVSTMITFVNAYNHGTYPVGTYAGSTVTHIVGGVPRAFLKITKKIAGACRLQVTAPTSADRDRVLRAYTTLGLYEGQSDTAQGLSAAEAAEIINTVGKLLAAPRLTRFESGDSGTVTGTITLTVPLGQIDTSVAHTDDQLLLKSGPSSGYHRITDITDTTVTTITVDSDTPFDYAGTPISLQSWAIVREVLEIASTKTDLTSSIAVSAASANSTLGFSVGSTVGTTTGFQVFDTATGQYQNFVQADVVVGDFVIQRSPGTVTHTVLAVSTDGLQLEITPPLDNTSVALEFTILSAAALAYADLVEALVTWDATLAASHYQTDISELMRVMNPILYNARPTQAQKVDALSALSELQEVLADLSDLLVAFVVAPVPRIDAALKMLQERALDRAYDLILSGYVSQFFGMDMDDASRSAYMLKTMRDIVQSDLPQSRLDEYGDDTSLRQSWTSTDANYDTSDRDRDENVAILGEVAQYPDWDLDSPRKRF